MSLHQWPMRRRLKKRSKNCSISGEITSLDVTFFSSDIPCRGKWWFDCILTMRFLESYYKCRHPLRHPPLPPPPIKKRGTWLRTIPHSSHVLQFNRMSSFMFHASGFNHYNHALVTMWVLLQLEPTVLPRCGQMFVLVLSASTLTSPSEPVNLQISQYCWTFALCTKHEIWN